MILNYYCYSLTIDSLDYYFTKLKMIPLISIARRYSVVISHCSFLLFWFLNYADSAFDYTNPFRITTYYHTSSFVYFCSYHFTYSMRYHIFYLSRCLMYCIAVILNNYFRNHITTTINSILILHTHHHLPCILLHANLSLSTTDSRTTIYHVVFSKRTHFRWN